MGGEVCMAGFHLSRFRAYHTILFLPATIIRYPGLYSGFIDIARSYLIFITIECRLTWIRLNG